MKRLSQTAIFATVAAAVALGGISAATAAGPVSITQERAIAGGISSGDGPGFPILITDPGSYRFDSDLYPANAPYAIFISSPNVTIDFRGFRLYGGATSPGGGESLDGIIGTQPGATIKNGTITKFRRYGIFTGEDFWTIENMNILGNGTQSAQGGSDAITCGKLCVVRNSSITGNRGKAVRAGEASLVEGTMIAENCDGIEMLQGGMALGNLIVRNALCHSETAPIRGNADDPNVGYGNNVILHSSQAVGVLPLTPNVCEGGC